MNKIIVCVLFFGILLLNAVNLYGCEINSPLINAYCIEKDLSLNQNQDIAGQVKNTFDAVRKNGGGQTLLDKLKLLGEKVIPFLEPYLNDENMDVRREVVYLAIEIGSEKSLNLLALALHNSEPEIQRVTSRRLYFYYSQYKKYLPVKKVLPPRIYAPYESFSPEKIGANPQLGKALKESLKAGNGNTSTIYLLANFPNGETTIVLKELSLKSSTDFNSIALASKIVLSGFDNQEATRDLVAFANKNDVKLLFFLLDQIGEIKSTELLSALAKTLDNKSDITVGKGLKNPNRTLANGIKIQGIPARRLCDFAVNAFVERFGLNVGFGLHSTVYLEKQISEVRDLVKQAIPTK